MGDPSSRPPGSDRPTAAAVFAALAITFASSFLMGYNVSVLNQPTEYVKHFYNDTYSARQQSAVDDMTITVYWAITNAIFIVGMFIGGIIGGALADRIGRKNSIAISQSFSAVGVILAVLCEQGNAPEMLIIARFLLGITVGVGNTITPMFLGEIVAPSMRGAFLTLHQLLVTFGIFFASVMGLPQLLTGGEHWPFLFLVELAPIGVGAIIVPLLHDSPRYLLLVKGDEKRTLKALHWYRGRDADHAAEMQSMMAAKEAQQTTEPFTARELWTKKLRRPLFIATFLQVVQQFSGINAIMFYSTSIYVEAGVSHNHIPIADVITMAVNFVTTIVAVPLMEALGRRALLIWPMWAMVLDMIVIAIMMSIERTHPWAAYVTIVCVVTYVIMFAVGLGPIPWMVGTELFLQRPRPAAMTICGLVNAICTFIIVIGFEPVAAALHQYIFVIFAILMVGFTVFVIILVPETRNKQFDEIERDMEVIVQFRRSRRVTNQVAAT